VVNLSKWLSKLKRLLISSTLKQSLSQNIPDKTQIPLSSNPQENLKKLNELFSDASDIVIRQFEIDYQVPIKAFIIYVDGLVDRELVQMNLMKPLMLDVQLTKADGEFDHENALNIIYRRVLTISEVREVKDFQETVNAVLSGDTALFVEGSNAALIASLHGWESRNVMPPDTDAVVRGPREGFTETLRTSTSQLRRKIKNPNLKFENMKIGKQTQTDVVIAYIKGIANEKIVEEVKRRLSKIDTDAILESGYIEQYIEDSPWSFLPTVGNSEKPDIVAAKILEGRVAILIDGSPFVLTVPYLFIEAFQSSEDYYSRPFYSSIVRLLRFTAYFISVFSPAVYVALTTYHQEMLPPAMLYSLAAAREGTPFPAFVEAMMMGIIYEILKEAGIRLPRPVGQAVSIVGALVIGESAVSAGLIGAPMVIVVSLTAISSYVVASISDTITIMRLTYVLLAAFMGLFGIMIGAAGFLTHMVSLRSFGVPYLAPLAPIVTEDLKDVFFRPHLWSECKRPKLIAKENIVRVKSDSMPKPPENNS
jgi:spore germination protein KA